MTRGIFLCYSQISSHYFVVTTNKERRRASRGTPPWEINSLQFTAIIG